MARSTVAVAIFYLGSMAVLASFNVIGAGAADVTEQAKLGPADLMRTFGYDVEVHKVTTEDGYILEVDRIPHSPTSSGKNQRPAVLLVHGILANAVSWVANLPSQSPGFLLSDAGFDVWLINCRGVPESNFHQTLTTKDPKFWKWTFDEIGRYDLSAVIDYILKETQLPNISLLTTSRGFTSSAVLLSLRPEYNDKVNLLIGYAPVANITYFTSPLRLVIPFAGPVKAINDFLTRGGFLVQSQTQKNLIATVCNSPLRDACYAPLATMFGINPKQLNKTRIPVYVANNPVGTSSQELVHYAQVYNAKNFIRYDYGKEENQERYGQDTPPEYPLEKIRVPFAVFKGKVDELADPKDVQDLIERLRDIIVTDYEVPDPHFGHLDFIYGFNAKDILHRPMIQLLSNYTSAGPQ